MIQLEYYYGYEKLIEKLKEYTNPRKVYDINAKQLFIVGEIYASK
ncbi:MAG: hypothetical protein QW478_07865 [Candidatus Micrarchaeaceae archaeon]